MKIPSPAPLRQQKAPLDDPDWIYEIKHDGFRALAVIEHGRCRFLSRKKHKLYGFRDLRDALVREGGDEHLVLATFITCAFLNVVMRFIVGNTTLREPNGLQDGLIIWCHCILAVRAPRRWQS
jgi:hypothetical protein